jgi:hypothetical protein
MLESTQGSQDKSVAVTTEKQPLTLVKAALAVPFNAAGQNPFALSAAPVPLFKKAATATFAYKFGIDDERSYSINKSMGFYSQYSADSNKRVFTTNNYTLRTGRLVLCVCAEITTVGASYILGFQIDSILLVESTPCSETITEAWQFDKKFVETKVIENDDYVLPVSSSDEDNCTNDE